MAALVEQAIAAKNNLVVEAASGSGKTVAISHRLWPKARRDHRVALLQGRSHYLCPYYLQKNLPADDALTKQKHAKLAQLDQHFRWLGTDDNVFIASLPAMQQASSLESVKPFLHHKQIVSSENE